jgi:hypothetical protein
MLDLRRRQFITLLGVAAAWPLAARAQQSAMPVVGFLGAGARGPLREQIATFHEGLKESGYVEGQNVAVEYRFAEGQFDRFPALASDLVRRQVAVLFVASNAGALAAKQAGPAARGAGGGSQLRGATRCRARQCGKRFRYRVFDACPTAGHGAPGLRLSILQYQAPAACRAGRTPCFACDL